MPLHSLELVDDYSLIGIHSSVEDYKLAYLLNKNLNTKFVKYNQYLDFKNSKSSFSIFEFVDTKNQLENYLISNKYIDNNTENLSFGLFTEDIFYSNTTFLIAERKKVDYFLKIEGNISNQQLNKTIKEINSISQIITSYSINPSNLKSKDFLIF